MFTDTGLSAIGFSFSILAIALLGLLVEQRIAVRVVLLLEVSLAAIVGYVICICTQIGSGSFILTIVILIIAAVESILLLAFVVLLHRLYSVIDLMRLQSLQF